MPLLTRRSPSPVSWPVLMVTAALGGLPDPASAFDCARAGNPLEHALCANPDAKAADDAMEAAFRTAKSVLDADGGRALLADQRKWLDERNKDCRARKDMADCAAKGDRARADLLAARPEAGPGTPGRLVPVFVDRPGSRTAIAVDVTMYRFLNPATPGERAFNAAVDRLLAEVPTVKDEPDDRDWTYERAAAIHYASDRLLSVSVGGYDYTGGAHGGTTSYTINVDLRSGRELRMADLLDGAGLAKAAARCMVDIGAQKKEREIDLRDAAARKETEDGVRKGVADLSTWDFGSDAATVNFGQYALGAYVEGEYDCALPYADLKSWAKPGFPLPER